MSGRGRQLRQIAVTGLGFVCAVAAMRADTQAQGRGGGTAAASQSARAAAPIDLTGYWVAVITEDWRWRMVAPAKGDYASIPLTVDGKRVADTWDPGKDEAAGEQCRSYGAPGLMRAPTLLHITWQDDNTLKLETDYGIQTRMFHFGAARSAATPSWQGLSAAEWVMPAGARGQGQGGAQAQGGGQAQGEGAAPPRFGTMKSVTTRLRPGYLRKNGVPYSTNTVFTEYWAVHLEENGDQWLVVTNAVTDPVNLQIPWITSLHFKKERDGSKWDPTPCSARF